MTEQKIPDITLYTAGTPNGVKASITLEELGLPYKVREMSFAKGEQKEPWFLDISPNGKIPAITDGDFSVFESGAIMIYLCEHYDHEGKLLPKDPYLRSKVIQWVMFHVGGIGPTQVQANHFHSYASERVPYGMKRFTGETKQLYTVLDNALKDKNYLVGDTYSLADIISYPWIRSYPLSGISNIDDLPNLKAWVARIDERPATQKGLNVPTPDRLKEIFEKRRG